MISPGSGPKLFTFGDFQLDLAAHDLRCSGQKVSIQDQPLRILVILLSRKGALVTRQELRDAIWPADTFVDFEQSLNTAIRKLRRALKDDPEKPRFIETVPRHGYRFAAVINETKSPLAPLEETSDGAALLAVGRLAPGASTTPVSDSSNRGDGQAGARRPDAFWEVTLQMGLFALAVMLAAVSLFGGGFRGWLTARASTPAYRTITVLPFEDLARSHPKAYEPYLRGLYFLNKRDPENIDKAMQSFREGLSADGKFAPAYAGLADCYILQILNGMPQEEGVANAKKTAAKALELDDSLAEAHTALGAIESFYEWNWPAAKKEFQRALEINPAYPLAHHWYAQLYLAPRGRLDDALAEMKRAHELDPLSEIIQTDLGYVYYLRRENGAALAAYERVLELDPEFVPAHMRMSQLFESEGHYGAAIKEMELQIRYGYAGKSESRIKQVEDAYRGGGYRGVLEASLAAMRETNYAGGEAEIYLRLGRSDFALADFGRALEAHDPMMIYLNVDPAHDAIRPDARFKELLARIGLEE